MIMGIGVDVCDVSRWQAAAARHPGMVRKVLTEAEAATPSRSQAARFAAKEALYKALGGGDGLSWHDCEVVSDGGLPRFELRGSLARRVLDLGVARVHLSLSHDAGVAVAMVVCEG
ncbi:holo-ACP synthase [Cutibacterium equinum]|uniref:Holo-[acyl-carrier-protein] synthase n=1 Tax=Cutibacterium equinum TaxID=3016342 RepID=A0ABY7QWN4_9ACTN|nr:holo-ACP synthase [Cutibacterium equinum]WCC79478.1 holo-ACP synthase [Cutibacterium equinum]